NLSYEAVDLLLSFDVARTVRLYGGGGTLVRIDPGDLNRPFAQGGVELAPPYPLLGGQLFPLAAVDVPADDETGWDPSVSVRAGIEVQSGLLTGRRLCRRWPATTAATRRTASSTRTGSSFGGSGSTSTSESPAHPLARPPQRSRSARSLARRMGFIR
ncbi:MAG TPA: DUF1207 domain-containing protein, partial [Geminicoccaceae bacterium]|nr:DUF1207 domain-containing protein [Geminicoccaceae bacterium]